MRFIFDEHVSQYIVALMYQLGEDVCHTTEVYGVGAKDPDMLPDIAQKGWTLITADIAMNHTRGNHGHRAILIKTGVKVLFLPPQFRQKSAWDKASWIFKH